MFSRSPHPSRFPGVSGRIAGDSEATLALQYDDLVLDDARPVRPGMTPADAVFGVVCALRDTPADESWRESADGTALTVLHYRSESGDETIEKLVWLREDNMQPVYAELFADGTRELSPSGLHRIRKTADNAENQGMKKNAAKQASHLGGDRPRCHRT